MARIRSLKPEFWGSPSHRGAHPWVRLFYEAMWNWADDSGRGTANPRELHSFAFPDDEDGILPKAEETPRLLAEVAQRYGVKFYRVDGRRYYCVTTWDRHQRVERRAGSRYPDPAEGSPYDPGPEDGITFTEYRKLRHRGPDAARPAPEAPRGPAPAERGNGYTVRPRTTQQDLLEWADPRGEQGMPESPSRRTGTPPRHGGNSSAGTGEQGNRGTAPTERPARAGRAGAATAAVLADAEPEPVRAELALVTPAEPAPAKPRTVNQRANDLATVFYDAVKKRTNFIAAVKVIVVFLDDEYTDAQIQEALLRLAAEGWTLSRNTLNRALTGPPRSTTTKPTASQRAARTLALMTPENDSHAS